MSNTHVAEAPEVLGLHHWAYRCRDAEETRHFYEDILGLPLAHEVQADHVPSTGQYSPYLHLFFRMHDGSYIAFFDLGDGVAAAPSPNTPAWVNHLAMRVGSVDDVKRMKARLQEHGIETIGVVDHEFVQSIYFFDPNGIRLEFTADTVGDAERDEFERDAHKALARWRAQQNASSHEPQRSQKNNSKPP